MQEALIRPLGQKDTLEKEMATFLLGKANGQRACQATVHGVANRHDLATE